MLSYGEKLTIHCDRNSLGIVNEQRWRENLIFYVILHIFVLIYLFISNNSAPNESILII